MPEMLTANSFILGLLEFPVPLPSSFAGIDLSDFPTLTGAFAFGPVAGVTIELEKTPCRCCQSPWEGSEKGRIFAMEAKDYLYFIVHDIHTTIVATVDDAGLPATCAIDMMDSDGNSLYFLTAKGKSFYERLKKKRYLSLTGIKGKDTMSCTAVSVRGKVRELGAEKGYRAIREKSIYVRDISR